MKDFSYGTRLTILLANVTSSVYSNSSPTGIPLAIAEIFKLYDYNTWFKFSLFNCWKVSDHNVDLYYTRLCKFHWNEKK